MKQVQYGARILVFGMAVGAMALTGCSAHVGTTSTLSIPQDKLAQETKQQLEKAVHQTAKSVVCDGGLEGKVGATQRCVLTAMDGGKVGVTDTVTKVDGTDIHFEAQADNKPMS